MRGHVMLLSIARFCKALSTGFQWTVVNLQNLVLLLMSFKPVLSCKSLFTVLALIGMNVARSLICKNMLVIMIYQILSFYKVSSTIGVITYLSFSFKL